MKAPARLGRKRRLALLAALAILAAGCPGGAGDGAAGSGKPLETVDVEAPPDATFDLEGDLKEQRRQVTQAGLLPGGFPADLPRYSPSSVVDFGEAVEGRHYVELHTSDDLSTVEDKLAARAAAAGWRRSGGSGWEKGGRRVVIRLRSLDPGTAIVVEYTPE